MISEKAATILGGLELLLAAIHADDPKRELLVRVGDLMRDARSLPLHDATIECNKEAGAERLPVHTKLLEDINTWAHAKGTNAAIREVLQRAYRAIRKSAPLALIAEQPSLHDGQSEMMRGALKVARDFVEPNAKSAGKTATLMAIDAALRGGDAWAPSGWQPIETAREAVIAAARKMPRATPACGAACTVHPFELEASTVWDLDRALKALDAALIAEQASSERLEGASSLQKDPTERDELYGYVNGLLGLLQLLRGRDDIPDAVKEIMRTNHRTVDAAAYLTQIVPPDAEPLDPMRGVEFPFAENH